MSSGVFSRTALRFGIEPGEAIIFAYCPKRRGMVRVRVPEASVRTTEAFYRKQGFEVSTLRHERHGHGSTS